jgi:amino acid transporter
MTGQADPLPSASVTDRGQPSIEPTRLTLRGAVVLGVGAMVGAGIFALLGEAGAIAGAATWISFVIAGLISLALGYTFVKLGARYPSAGGLITYLIEGFGNGRLVGVASWLGYVTAIVVVGAMVAVSFGDYAASIIFGSDADPVWTKLFASLVVIASAALVVVGCAGSTGRNRRSSSACWWCLPSSLSQRSRTSIPSCSRPAGTRRHNRSCPASR